MIRRSIGPHHGVIVSGLLGGIVSSTSVTWTFARESRAETAPRLALGAGVVAACTVMLVRVLIASAVLNPALSSQLPRYIGLAFLIGAAVVLIAWRASGAKPVQNGASDSPLQLKAALQMTALFQIVLFVVLAVQARLGSHALIATSVFVGLTDLDALTLSLARSTSPADIPLASLALVSGILSNTLLKMMVTVFVGRGSFRTLTAAVLIAMVVSTAIMVVLR